MDPKPLLTYQVYAVAACSLFRGQVFVQIKILASFFSQCDAISLKDLFITYHTFNTVATLLLLEPTLTHSLPFSMGTGQQNGHLLQRRQAGSKETEIQLETNRRTKYCCILDTESELAHHENENKRERELGSVFGQNGCVRVRDSVCVVYCTQREGVCVCISWVLGATSKRERECVNEIMANRQLSKLKSRRELKVVIFCIFHFFLLSLSRKRFEIKS